MHGGFDSDALETGLEETEELTLPVFSGLFSIEAGGRRETVACELPVGKPLTIGSGRDADLRLRERGVSALHCSLQLCDGVVQLRDLDSKNGVYVGGARVGGAIFTGAGGTFVLGGVSVSVYPSGSETECSAKFVPGLVGRSASMRRVAELVHRYARLKKPVLIQGESGTGKDVVASALHSLGKRRGDYVAMNVGAISESLADAELFGHKRGAFTGAVESREGAFEQAHRGTLFLDEVAELPPGMQVKLLRVVEDGVVRPVGGKSIEVDARIVSASWAPLRGRVASGQFRGDLYHRLSTLVIELPPLRRRKSDIPELARTLLGRFEPELGNRRLSSAALGRLVAHDWPGNVRELSSVLYRAAVAADKTLIDELALEESLPSLSAAGPKPLRGDQAAALLERCAGNVSKAARAARVPRSTFRSWLAQSTASRGGESETEAETTADP